MHFKFALDFILLRIIDIYSKTIFNERNLHIFIKLISVNIDHSKYSMEYKIELKALAHSVLCQIQSSSLKGSMMFQKLNLLELINQSLVLIVLNINGIKYQEAVKKWGVKKCNYTSKLLCLQFKALSEWNLPLNSNVLTATFNESIIIFDWIEADRYLSCIIIFIIYLL